MFEGVSMGPGALIPLVVTIALAFWTKNAIFALFIGCLVGVGLVGLDPARGFAQLAESALGNEDFIWIMLIILFIGMLFSLFKAAGVVQAFTEAVSRKVRSRRSATVLTWFMGLVIIDDYFSPLMSGVVMRPLTDVRRISREKLAYILDSTTASVCTLVPFMAWGAFIAGLALKQGGPLTSMDQAVAVFARSIPYNFYSILTMLMALLVAAEVFPDFGPMKAAERRAQEEGKVFRDGANLMTGSETEELLVEPGRPVHMMMHLVIPLLVLVGVAVFSFVATGGIKICEAFIATVLYLAVAVRVTKTVPSLQALMEYLIKGIQDVQQALLILALAYCLNSITKGLGASDYILHATKAWMTPNLLVVLTFLSAALMSFSTGTSWGTYALVIPFSLPLAYGFSGGALTPLVLKTLAAATGGGVFGDHASPVSDTTVLSSMGAGCDHIDHVKTQLPYALLVATVTTSLYLLF